MDIQTCTHELPITDISAQALSGVDLRSQVDSFLSMALLDGLPDGNWALRSHLPSSTGPTHQITFGKRQTEEGVQYCLCFHGNEQLFQVVERHVLLLDINFNWVYVNPERSVEGDTVVIRFTALLPSGSDPLCSLLKKSNK